MELEKLYEQINRQVMSPDFSIEDLENLTILRNVLLIDYPSVKSKEKSNENSCSLFFDKQIPREFRAYHAGLIGQKELSRRTRGFELEGRSTDTHIFFSLSLKDVLSEYVIPESHKNNGVYVIDLRRVKDARVQTDYSSEVIWNDKIRTLRDCYQDPEFMRMLLTTHRCHDTKYIEPYINYPKEKLREVLIDEIDSWLSNYTIQFKLENLPEYRAKKLDYILVPSPIMVT